MIGERLSEIRKDHGDTQAKLAGKLCVSLSTVRSWEQEKSSPNYETLVTLCRLYNVSADYLLGLSDDDPIYSKLIRKNKFTKEERMEIRTFEDFVISKRKNQ